MKSKSQSRSIDTSIAVTKSPPAVLYRTDGPIVWITLNRPEKRNAINSEMRAGLVDSWRRMMADDTVRVGILTGAGDKAFSSGGDLNEMSNQRELTDEERFADTRSMNDMLMGPSEFGLWKPLIAAINGYALAGGWMLAQHCDIRIAARHALLGIPEVQHGIASPFISDLLDIIGLGHLLEIVLTGEPITAQRAYEIGFVNRVVEAEHLLAEAETMARLIASRVPEAVEAHKEVTYKARGLSRGDAVHIANRIFQARLNSEDRNQRLRSFLERE